jgi:hypothetical protein
MRVQMAAKEATLVFVDAETGADGAVQVDYARLLERCVWFREMAADFGELTGPLPLGDRVSRQAMQRFAEAINSDHWPCVAKATSLFNILTPMEMRVAHWDAAALAEKYGFYALEGYYLVAFAMAHRRAGKAWFKVSDEVDLLAASDLRPSRRALVESLCEDYVSGDCYFTIISYRTRWPNRFLPKISFVANAIETGTAGDIDSLIEFLIRSPDIYDSVHNIATRFIIRGTVFLIAATPGGRHLNDMKRLLERLEMETHANEPDNVDLYTIALGYAARYNQREAASVLLMQKPMIALKRMGLDQAAEMHHYDIMHMILDASCSTRAENNEEAEERPLDNLDLWRIITELVQNHEKGKPDEAAILLTRLLDKVTPIGAYVVYDCIEYILKSLPTATSHVFFDALFPCIQVDVIEDASPFLMLARTIRNGKQEQIGWILDAIDAEEYTECTMLANFTGDILQSVAPLDVLDAMLSHPRIDVITGDTDADSSQYGFLFYLIRFAVHEGSETSIALLTRLLAHPAIDPAMHQDEALLIAAEVNNTVAMRMLLKDPRVNRSHAAQCLDPLYRAINYNSMEAARLLLADDRTPPVSVNGNKLLKYAMKKKADAMAALVIDGPRFTVATEEEGRDLLHYAYLRALPAVSRKLRHFLSVRFPNATTFGSIGLPQATGLARQ